VDLGRQRAGPEDGQIIGVVTAFTDFTDRQRLLELLRAQALTDSLTGLANRRAFDDRLSTELSRARRQGDPIVLALLDIDRFKELNDRHGHPEGDRALTRVAKVVRDGVRAEDHVARLAGDEFAVVLPATDEAEAEEVISRVVDAIAEDEVLRTLGATVSAGLAQADLGDGARREAAAGVDADALYRRADAALYAAKRRAGGPGAR
jgi:diguanylate cyclase (GGDEF)-like protein